MPETIAVQPAEGLSIRNPDRAFRLLKVGGELVPANSFWLRRIATQDVVEISPEDWKKREADKLSAAKEAEAAAKKAADDAKAAKKPSPAPAEPAPQASDE